MKTRDLAGQRFGRLDVLERAGSDSGGNAMWLCACDCGARRVVAGCHLRSGHTTSCGCFAREKAADDHEKHGHAQSRTEGRAATRAYTCWTALIGRCTNPRNRAWRHYGGRGITVCARWLGENGFENFLADMGEPPPGRSIDRIDNDRGYSPANCRWATPLEQVHNRRPYGTASANRSTARRSA